MLTVCAGLLARSFVRVQSVDLGFQPTKVLSADLRTTYFGSEGYSFWRRAYFFLHCFEGALQRDAA